MNRPITMAALLCRSSACSAFAFAVASLPFLIRPLALWRLFEVGGGLGCREWTLM
jgi:hypothetical protein